MALLTIANLIAQAKTDLEAISGIGTVYDRRRDVRDEATARNLWFHTGQGRIHAWSITLGEPTKRSTRTTGFGARGSNQKGLTLSDIVLVYEGVFGIDDANASEVTFRNLCETIVDSFNGIGLIHADVVDQLPMQWEKFGYLVLAGMWSTHFARLSCRYTGRAT